MLSIPIKFLQLFNLVSYFRRQRAKASGEIVDGLRFYLQVRMNGLGRVLEGVDIFRCFEFDQGIVKLFIVVPSLVLKRTEKGAYSKGT